jgi:hypothetical protein
LPRKAKEAAAAEPKAPAADPKAVTVEPSTSSTGSSGSPSKAGGSVTLDRRSGGNGWSRRLASSEAAGLLAQERVALATVLAFLEDVVPDLAEVRPPQY